MPIEILPEEKWNDLAEIFATEFDSDIPNLGKADIIAETEDGKIKSFIVAEHLMRIGQIYRLEKDAHPRQLIRWLEANMPRDVSVITIASEPRFESLYRKMGMRKVEGTLFRRDF